MGKITALEAQKRNKQRVNIYIDNEFAFAVSLIEAVRLRTGQELSDVEIARLQGEDTVGKAVDSAGNFLGYRPRSIQEVGRNLTEKEYPADVIEAAIDRLTSMGYLDDGAFARFWVQNRGEFKPLSNRALRQELRQKGVADTVINETLSENDESELAYQAASKQVRRLRNLAKRDFRVKLSAFLQRRGFTHNTAHDVVLRLIDELEVQDPNTFNRTTEDEEE